MSTPKLSPCPCCGSKVLSEPGDYEICEICGWEDDPVQSADPDFAGGANELSLNEAREQWAKKAAAKTAAKPSQPPKVTKPTRKKK